MKNLLFVLLVVVIGLVYYLVFLQEGFMGAGPSTTGVRTVEPFDRITSGSVVDLEITQAATPSVEVVASKRLQERVQTTVANGTLSIQLKTWNFWDGGVTVRIKTPRLSSLMTSGTGEATIMGFADLDRLTLGSSGTGDIEVAGRGNVLEFSSSGTGDLEAFDYSARAARVRLSGTGSAEVTVSDSLTGQLTGTGDVRYRGTPTVDVTLLGTGDVVAAN
ncbi:hypothetical protein LEM8419_00430 [Neolewinella maritima]|uniref:Putative auto-transporter adhesin head GIN domain-containing protein n=1 Tax=Neolewinella maritima TaxID=1383882 RepID=A0ABM9AWU8_9BACT|nr:head GIN domain-containing protein [Neolewinella maritima]CAH0999134.1 hypothetical protein LEM8419_00430 [Neolewinella maritima]